MRAPAFLVAAASAAELIAQPAVAQRWSSPSALPGFTVGGLAEHLAGQVFSTVEGLAAASSPEEEVPLLEHYARAVWVGADRDAEVNVMIRGKGEQLAGEGPAGLVARLAEALVTLRRDLPDAPETHRISPPAGPWSLVLDDFLVTRMMEITVHSDDLAYSVGLSTPDLPGEVEDPVLGLLVALAARRHGPTALIRALARAERAPATIAAL